MLKGKVALVTGGSRGIGKAIVEVFSKEGAKVAFFYTKESEEIKKLEKKGEIFPINCDVRDFEAVKLAFENISKRFGPLSILVNNAGITRDALFVRMSEKDWDEVLEVNLKGTFNCTRVAIRQMMKKREGSIINISSVAGQMGNPGQANYSASKAGIVGFTKSLAREYGRYGIRVNAISPGFIETSMTEKIPEDKRKEVKSQIPLGRFGSPYEVANLALFLASDYSSYITGQVIGVNGGLYM